ncbi:MAG TPA: VTT domain-containing protein [Candidatus Dormibacteraeota bacterium]
MTSIEQLHGPVLLGVICLLIFVEECGVPLPFAPGDLLLALCGLAIRNGSLHPLLAIAAVYLTTIAGAMCGRELFEVVGARILRRLTGTTRLRGSLDRAARLLARGGWPAVLVGRLTPGLRIHTNEVAGLLGLPRRTFLFGLAPGAAVYVAVFTGAGMLFGRQAMELLLHAVHRLGLGVTVLLVVLLWVGLAWGATRLFRTRESGSESGRA